MHILYRSNAGKISSSFEIEHLIQFIRRWLFNPLTLSVLFIGHPFSDHFSRYLCFLIDRTHIFYLLKILSLWKTHFGEEEPLEVPDKSEIKGDWNEKKLFLDHLKSSYISMHAFNHCWYSYL